MNPELRRNLWLELTPNRMIATPAILALLGLLIFLTNQTIWQEIVAYAAFVIFFAVTLVWGGRQAYDSIVDEMRNNTWDTQRMSALTPWTMMVGKFFGSTAFSWYIGGLCLAAFAFFFDAKPASIFDKLSLTASSTGVSENWVVLSTCLLLIFAALIVQANSFLSGLMLVRSGQTIKKSRNLIVILVVGLVILRWLSPKFTSLQEPTQWFGYWWNTRDFILVSLIVFTAWAWFAAYRVMSNILQVQVIPLAGLSFVIFLSTYLYGFHGESLPPEMLPDMFLKLIFFQIVAMIWVYLSAWKERRDWIALRRFLQAWQEGPLNRALKTTPDWIPVALFALVCALAGIFLLQQVQVYEEFEERINFILLLPLTAILLVLRDIGLLYFFSLGKRPERAMSITLLCLVLLYGIFPHLLQSINLEALALPFMTPANVFWRGIIIALFHVGIVAELLRRRIRKISTSIHEWDQATT